MEEIIDKIPISKQKTKAKIRPASRKTGGKIKGPVPSITLTIKIIVII